MTSRARLDDAEVTARLERLPAWTRQGDALVRKVTARTFRDAQRLVNRVCDVAEGMNHHPDLHWVWAHVTFSLNTHDAGGITALDFHLAACIDDVLADFA